LPLLYALRAWLAREVQKTLLMSPVSNAIRYVMRLWDNLLAYHNHGQLEIDKYLMNNVIRPFALGRKNWLFVGSYDAIEYIAMYWSFFATCGLKNIDPHKWIRFVLDHINTTARAQYHSLLPNFTNLELVR
jgi:hypothetical protein